MVHKKKFDRLDFIKIKIFSLPKTLKRIQRQATDWEKLFPKHIPDKELVSKIHKEFLKLNSKKTTQVKVGKWYEQKPHHRRYIGNKEVYEKLLNINLSLGIFKLNQQDTIMYLLEWLKKTVIPIAGKDVGTGRHSLLMGRQISIATLLHSLVVSC